MDATRRTMASPARAMLVLVVTGAAVAAIALWLMEPYQAPLPTSKCVISDRSDSMVAALGCRFVVGVSAQAVYSPDVAKGSRLFIYGTGDATTGFEPIQIGAYDIPTAVKVTDGGEAVGAARKALLDRISADCEKATTVTSASPIYMAVRRAMEQLNATGCGTKTVCRLDIRTEGEETEEPWLREATLEGKMKPSGLPAALDNSNIAVTICGLSETVREVKEDKKAKQDKGKSASANADLRQVAWKKVFTTPEAVVFLPFCPRSDADEKSSTESRSDANVSLRRCTTMLRGKNVALFAPT